MEKLHFEYAGSVPVKKRAHVGVVASGDMEILLEPVQTAVTEVDVITRFDGSGEIWEEVFNRFFAENPISAKIQIHDFGARPGLVSLRMLQVLEECMK